MSYPRVMPPPPPDTPWPTGVNPIAATVGEAIFLERGLVPPPRTPLTTATLAQTLSATIADSHRLRRQLGEVIEEARHVRRQSQALRRSLAAKVPTAA
jgi:hypothetical protein